MNSFDDYVRARGTALLRFGYLLGGDAHLAEDLVQEALARCHRSWPRISAAGDPDAYVRKAVLRQFLSWRRRFSFGERVTADMTPHAAATADRSEAVADREVLWRLLAGLSRMQRAVLVLRFYEDLAYAQIADLLDVGESTVRVHAHKGLSALRVSPQLVGEKEAGR
ncbi:SigE family RNA polymerase sigma factor [Phytomonospora endophytica]|uniref:RNA polymerase sigma-70 factor (Sigma-E family) n=1 Tax=Phytomonospora endophytica TaxID=714109 RepID=A0A841FLM2_9ACTN|nr:SigE family RNA polymerase sigma factor [Phytomonospora endophytica]MBB6034442.1 RNA polymerase sigma-70 factor (sigma-E family) [Phytomonospora endophytica]GIG66836.1 RNA polymerase subunit sigma-24 [Phytomonospora endophytica]